MFSFFTADWCLTCKVNEAAAIERPSTRAAFERAGVVVLKGVSIGRSAVVAAGSIVTKDVKACSIVAGNPAKFVRLIDA